ncbi:DUF2125 domain-containing protein [Methylobrevis pamukkalensis]|uniref:DUF2125 domain-containing protein n=1 Tax=Methylobrevis pamukkalensis TaxID=1439726 RepID=UPI0008461DD7|nr:DUF2125 domain-containing protein [Methylobrevis pamukkalensis]
MSRSFIVLATLAAAVIAAWSGGWYWLSGEADRRIDVVLDDLAGRGTTVTCAGREITGWPFRLEVDCRNPVVTLADAPASRPPARSPAPPSATGSSPSSPSPARSPSPRRRHHRRCRLCGDAGQPAP